MRGRERVWREMKLGVGMGREGDRGGYGEREREGGGGIERLLIILGESSRPAGGGSHSQSVIEERSGNHSRK